MVVVWRDPNPRGGMFKFVTDPMEPKMVTAWDLVAYFGTGGVFEARRPGGREAATWRDAEASVNETMRVEGLTNVSVTTCACAKETM